MKLSHAFQDHRYGVTKNDFLSAVKLLLSWLSAESHMQNSSTTEGNQLGTSTLFGSQYVINMLEWKIVDIWSQQILPSYAPKHHVFAFYIYIQSFVDAFIQRDLQAKAKEISSLELQNYIVTISTGADEDSPWSVLRHTRQQDKGLESLEHGMQRHSGKGVHGRGGYLIGWVGVVSGMAPKQGHAALEAKDLKPKQSNNMVGVWKLIHGKKLHEMNKVMH